MADLDECRETDPCSDAQAASDDYAARLAAVVFERRLARARTTPSAAHERSTSNQLWMSRNTRHTDVTS